ncbi:hypothetical protein [Beijerinckia sp. L45]|uniref:hypothetical protein n=1 Tax=Beijerinckia sp. L45 TaxID=1641855 RepID=UPI001AEDE911|nr:hypothetical protein [Beijerinckia sp. L45]
MDGGVELNIESDTGAIIKAIIDAHMAHHLAIALMQVPTVDDGNINGVPFLICKDPQSLAIGATDDADLTIMIAPNNMRPLQLIFSEDGRVHKIMTLMSEVLRTPRQMRFQDGKH